MVTRNPACAVLSWGRPRWYLLTSLVHLLLSWAQADDLQSCEAVEGLEYQPQHCGGTITRASSATGGHFTTLKGLAPVAAGATVQVPCTNTFLFAEVATTLHVQYPAKTPNADNLQLWDRRTNSYSPVHLTRSTQQLDCSSWTALPNGHIGMFACNSTGGDGTPDDIYIYDTTTQTAELKGALMTTRWSSSAVTLPDGTTLVAGGALEVGKPGWPAAGNERYSFASSTTELLPHLAEDSDESSFAGPGVWVLPSGHLMVVDSQLGSVHVLNWTSGVHVADAPDLPPELGRQWWQYRQQTAAVMLRTAVLAPESPARLEFLFCGGTNASAEAGEGTVGYAVVIGLNISAEGTVGFDAAWQVEEMPGLRTVLDAVLLPNGHVLIVNGGKLGFSSSANQDPSASTHASEPNSEAWVFNPNAPQGSRFNSMGERSRVARLRSSTALLTSQGDVLITGGATTKDDVPLDPVSWEAAAVGSSEYRVEVFTLPYVLTPERPVITSAPAATPYGSTMRLGFISDEAPLSDVVLLKPGAATRGYTMDNRAQLLDFTIQDGVLSVQIPTDSRLAPPGFYLIFLCSGEAYSEGVWVQLIPPPPLPPPTIPFTAQRLQDLLPKLTLTGIDLTAGARAIAANANGRTQVTIAAQGVTPVPADIRLTSNLVNLTRRLTYYSQLWLSSSRPCSAVVAWRDPAHDGLVKAAHMLPMQLTPQLFTLPPIAPLASGSFQLVVQAGLCPAGAVVEAFGLVAWRDVQATDAALRGSVDGSLTDGSAAV